MSVENKYYQYLKTLNGPFQKIVRLDFLQPDNSVAFSLGGENQRIKFFGENKSLAFVQSGSLSVSLNNGQRRKATITLSNLDGAFEYNVNKIWFGQQVRLLMGVLLPDDTEFYLPQGVFYIKDPQSTFKPNEKSVTFPLFDKWAYLDGTLSGKITEAYQVKVPELGTGYLNTYTAISSILKLSKYTHQKTTNPLEMIDSVTPVLTNYYVYNRYTIFYDDSVTNTTQATSIPYTACPYDITENAGGNYGHLLLQLNDTFVGLIGYDQTGALRVDASQDYINDTDNPILWNFTPNNSTFLGVTETSKNSEVYNQVVVVGEGKSGNEVWGSASNYDPLSDTNVNLIGLKPYYERKAEYWNSTQCADLAEYLLKRKTVLQKSITIECSQMFHLYENCLVTVQRTDKKGKPIEKHLINSFTIPIGETGNMTINATSVNDLIFEFVKNENIKLPADSNAVILQYIQSTGTQAIELEAGSGVKFGNNIDFEITFSVIGEVAQSDGEYSYILGSKDENNEYSLSTKNGGQFVFGTSVVNIPITQGKKYTISKKGNVLEDLSSGLKKSLPSATFSIDINGCVFGVSKKATTNSILYGNVRVYRLKIWDRDTLIGDYIPIWWLYDENDLDYSDIMLYDIVSNEEEFSRGTGNFLPGPLVK